MTTKPKSQAPVAYENNPFFVATNGLDLLFKKAQSVGILMAVLAGVSALASLPYMFMPPAAEPSQPTATDPEAVAAENEALAHAISNIPTEVWLIGGALVLIIAAVMLAIGIVFRGITDYTSAQLASGKQVTLNDAFRAVFNNFWSYTWVLVMASIKTFLWTLLFVIPGFVMSYRYSLAGVVFFDKALKGGAASTESAALTKGAWLTTFASQNLLNMITLGAIPMLLQPGTNGVLYSQLRTAGNEKPRAHFLSWLTLLLPIIFVALSIGVILMVALAIGVK